MAAALQSAAAFDFLVRTVFWKWNFGNKSLAAKEKHLWQDIAKPFAACAVEKGKNSS
jgi:hypothetical protein